MVHGIAKLAISHQLPFGNADLLEFTDTVFGVLSSGLAGVCHAPKPPNGGLRSQPAVVKQLKYSPRVSS